MRPLLGALVAIVAVAVLTAVTGHATSLSTGTKSLGSKSATLPDCDTDGMTIVQTTSATTVGTITVGSIAAACATGVMSVTVNNGVTSATAATQVVPSGGGSLSFSFALSATDAEQVDVAIKGP